MGGTTKQLGDFTKIEVKSSKDSNLPLFLNDYIEVELKDVPVKVNVFWCHGQDWWVFNQLCQATTSQVKGLQVLVVIGKLSKKDTDAFEYSSVEYVSVITTTLHQTDAFGHKLRLSQLLEHWTMLNEMADVTQAHECLLNDNPVVIHSWLLSTSVLPLILSFELQLVDCLADQLLNGREKAQI